MSQSIDLEAYLSEGVKLIVQDALKATLKSPRQSLFLARFSTACKQAEALRSASFEQGLHVPPFLIASITDQCNLHCAGCYAQANAARFNIDAGGRLTADDWDDIFAQAEALGICFILLAGGEPLMRPDVLERAAKHRNILFPVFTNGTLLQGKALEFFDAQRNLAPILSIEGDAARTDARRGSGVHTRLMAVMQALAERHILFGASITVTRENLANATDDRFLASLKENGCKLVFYVEYVPVTGATQSLALTETERKNLNKRLEVLRSREDDMVYIAFPGDELASGGCLAAGRGFFHINPRGGAEPCPFSPFSDSNVKTVGLREALRSSLFKKLTAQDILLQDHAGGCVLFGQEETVRQLLAEVEQTTAGLQP
jgi:MoaA/NifB/PqqE/SkfB family radical SAM enzyme